jgi:hypothetical protein
MSDTTQHLFLTQRFGQQPHTIMIWKFGRRGIKAVSSGVYLLFFPHYVDVQNSKRTSKWRSSSFEKDETNLIWVLDSNRRRQ